MVTVSIVIPTYNRLDQLKRVLVGLERQSYPLDCFEVLVVSDGSKDGTDAYLQSAEKPFNLKAFTQPNRGVAAARNYGVAQALGDIVLFIDDDVFPTPSLIEQHLRYHEQHGDRAVVIGPMVTPPDFKLSPWVSWEQETLAEQYRDMVTGKWHPSARQFYTGNTSISRHHLVESGGFDTTFRRAEDVELAYRLADLGLQFYFNPQAIGYHYAERSLASWLAIPYDYGHNDVIFSCQKGQGWLLTSIYGEFFDRHLLIRSLVHLCLDRPGISTAATKVLVRVMGASYRLKIYSLSRLACSGIFNLRYYQGMADEMGGRGAFLKGLAAFQAST